MIHSNVLRIRKTVLSLLFTFFLATCIAQETFTFSQGLAATIPYRYGREALYTDPLAYQLYTKNIKTPAPGVVFGTNASGEAITWQPLAADSVGRLVIPRTGYNFSFGRGGGYIYLTYTADAERTALLNVQGNSGLFFNGASHAGDPYNSGWLYIPVKLKKGLNELYVRGTNIKAALSFPNKLVTLNTEDPTVPTIVVSGQNKSLKGAVVVYNTSTKDLKGLQIRSRLGGKEVVTDLPSIPALSGRKVAFGFDGSDVTATGKQDCGLVLLEKGKVLDESKVTIEAVGPTNQYSATFVSAIDGSTQYYGVTPQEGGSKEGAALFLSVHGAGVEAIGQARAYRPKDWGTLVAPTNRRPRGFNWEDWGRLDALEVLGIATDKFKPHPQHIYLTGHSMGGHGTWFLGATYPDKWAAIAPCAGYPTLKGYGSADGLVPENASSPMEQMLLRSSNQSDVIQLASNYKPLGVYIFHGDADRVVSVNYARQMKKVLGEFHPDMSYYEYPGGEHWFGDHSVDWQPLFHYFRWHQRPVDTAVNVIDFKTASPGISATYRWASVWQQQQPLQYSRLQLQRDRAARSIRGTTENIRLLQLDLSGFGKDATVSVTLDSLATVSYTTTSDTDTLFLLKEDGKWVLGTKPDLEQKGPHRYGTFKDAFNHRMVFVYGTAGSKEENEWSLNKARYDAETWYYRGNGAVDIIPDKEFSLAKYKDRGVILYGNKNTNKAWSSLLNDCPIQVERGRVTAGSRTWSGDDLSTYFVWPIRSSAIASVGVVSGTGVKGMNGANANQYFAGASGFPDFMIYSLDMLQAGVPQVKLAGFYDHNWKLKDTELVEAK
jgi:pimeloyl-ACP methyl ester carboxylesterase